MTGLLAIACIAAAIACAVFALVAVDLPEVPRRGSRGAARARARQDGTLRAFEVLIRLIAAHVSRVPVPVWRRRIDGLLVQAGDYKGLSPDEFIAGVVLSSAAGLAGISLMRLFPEVRIPAHIVLFGALFGPCAVVFAVKQAARERFKAIDRALPNAIDLAAMCMGAGLDFPGALRQIVDNLPGKGSPMRDELERILQELSLGRTRKQALQGFAARVPSGAVVEFVNAAVQGEEKGTPLAEVLAIQAQTMRLRRSVLAEEAAARAGVLMMVPLMMLFGCIMVLVLGPVILEMAGGGLQ